MHRLVVGSPLPSVPLSSDPLPQHTPWLTRLRRGFSSWRHVPRASRIAPRELAAEAVTGLLGSVAIVGSPEPHDLNLFRFHVIRAFVTSRWPPQAKGLWILQIVVGSDCRFSLKPGDIGQILCRWLDDYSG